ncbi:ATP-binding protein [Marinobacterium arenosum]|uniref:ATP-binding protein n=1 Tax=Marinobacterium arenosum TaxID=2862496 RepID=UPI001C96794D|nr:ATP-binding protein [Marinobacterium arenosum]MBY4676456.1 two-component sensor histidine kinase [Marinobacterium arenosum]
MRLPNSLRSRLLLASMLLMPLVMLVAWWALLESYHNSLETAVRDRLQTQVYLLIGAAEVAGGEVHMPELLTEPRFNQLQSGLYGALHDADNRLLWRTTSSALLADSILPPPDPMPLPGELQFDHLADNQLYRVRFPVIWETLEKEHHLLFTVLESDQPTSHALAAYRKQLTFWFVAVLVLALAVQWSIMTWGLQPLKQLAADLKRIEAGEAEQLQGNYPTEVQAVTDNLNLLLHSEQQQRSRYRNTLGDLAHSLKTPLAVIRGAAEESQSQQNYQQAVEEQVDRMDQIVQYQLARAVKSQGPAPLSGGVALKPVVERILAALAKVYRDKGIDTRLELPDGLNVAADERDLMELLGNLLENAFKYGDDQVRVSASVNSRWLQIEIADNGPGISPALRQKILQRGERADTSVQGQGIGLAVAVDILSTYGGDLNVAEAPEGGALFQLSLPSS